MKFNKKKKNITTQIVKKCDIYPLYRQKGPRAFYLPI